MKKQKSTPLLNAVKVSWIDAGSNNEWSEVDKLKDPGICHTLGYLVKESDDFVHIAATIANDDNTGDIIANNIIAIPKGWISDFYEIKDANYKTSRRTKNS